MSTGMCSLDEVNEAIDCLKDVKIYIFCIAYRNILRVLFWNKGALRRGPPGRCQAEHDADVEGAFSPSIKWLFRPHRRNFGASGGCSHGGAGY